ncbi:hypothetical protein [uncultured Methanolobus sp.]|uniref:DUF7287 family protein n=1 Tax=uncultured Methanolobus sp. TaxID=218300 RepID=UPI0029C6DF52|nr:hypothetical protein [uncultured Methanolobus sp.]
MMDENGQVAVDFLMGISLFLIALMFVVQFIPGLFMPGSAGETSLDYTAYRTATILVEDPGWWGNSTSSSTDWEYHPDSIMRIGLAVDDENSSKSTNLPNLMSKSKIRSLMLVNESTLINRLGLYNNVNDAIFAYGYNISITKNDQYLIQNNKAITLGDPVPDDRDISRITRLVLVETGGVAYLNATELTTDHALPSEKAILNVTGPVDGNVTLQISNFNITGADPSFLNTTLEGTVLVQPADYTAYEKAGAKNVPLGSSLETDDVLCLDFNSTLFSSNHTYRLELIFDNITFTHSAPPFLEYTERYETLYEPACLTVEVWQ